MKSKVEVVEEVSMYKEPFCVSLVAVLDGVAFHSVVVHKERLEHHAMTALKRCFSGNESQKSTSNSSIDELCTKNLE